jgi:hypothetical protein
MSSQTPSDSEKCVSEEFGSQLLLQHPTECQRGYGRAKSAGCHGCAPNKAVA